MWSFGCKIVHYGIVHFVVVVLYHYQLMHGHELRKK